MDYSAIISEDIENVITDKAIPWGKLKDTSILITGSTGMIGRGCIRALGQLNDKFNFNIKIYALGRNIEKGKELEKITGVIFIQRDMKEPLNLNLQVDYIIHCAAITKSLEMVSNPVGLIETELSGSKSVLEFALANKVKGFIYTSSMESYGRLDLQDIKETDQGYINLRNPRSSYPMCKRMIELLCNAHYSQYQMPTKIVRLGMVFGAGEDFMNDNRVWAQFTKSALNKAPIILHTAGESLSSFVYLSDAVRGIFMVLLSDVYGETYNIATCSHKIKDFAQRIAIKFNIEMQIKPPECIEKSGYASEFKLPLNTDKLKDLGWKPYVTNVEEMVERVISNEKCIF